MFDVLVDELRTHPTEWLRRERERLMVEQRNLRTREMAVLRVLDERGQVDCSIGSQGESANTVREKVETARALESLSAVASVAMEGGFSDEQLSSVVRLADGESDREWAARGPNMDPIELARQVRKLKKPSAEDSRARYAARELKMWWNRDKTMLSLRGQLPDAMGARFETTITHLTEQMKVKGEPWRPFEQRSADALVALCDPPAVADDDVPSLATLAGLQVAVPLEGPAEIAGVPIADSLLEQLRANASITPVLVDDDGAVLAIGRAAPALSPKVRRAVLLRDARCRVPGCSRRRGWRCTTCAAPMRSPTSPRCAPRIIDCSFHTGCSLVGNPNLPDGLELVTASRAPPKVPV